MSAMDDLVTDYAAYWSSFTEPLRDARTFAQWCQDPVLCDQELRAQASAESLVEANEDLAREVIRQQQRQGGAILKQIAQKYNDYSDEYGEWDSEMLSEIVDVLVDEGYMVKCTENDEHLHAAHGPCPFRHGDD